MYNNKCIFHITCRKFQAEMLMEEIVLTVTLYCGSFRKKNDMIIQREVVEMPHQRNLGLMYCVLCFNYLLICVTTLNEVTFAEVELP